MSEQSAPSAADTLTCPRCNSSLRQVLGGVSLSHYAVFEREPVPRWVLRPISTTAFDFAGGVEIVVCPQPTCGVRILVRERRWSSRPPTHNGDWFVRWRTLLGKAGIVHINNSTGREGEGTVGALWLPEVAIPELVRQHPDCEWYGPLSPPD